MLHDVRLATVENVLFPASASAGNKGPQHYVTVFMEGGAAEPGAEPQLREPDKCSCWKWVAWEELSSLQPLFRPLRQLVASGYRPGQQQLQPVAQASGLNERVRTKP